MFSTLFPKTRIKVILGNFWRAYSQDELNILLPNLTKYPTPNFN
jgi:hypothetical protein